MKNLNQKKSNGALNRSQMKEVMGGVTTFRGICDDWVKSEALLCFQCCRTVQDETLCARKCGIR